MSRSDFCYVWRAIRAAGGIPVASGRRRRRRRSVPYPADMPQRLTTKLDSLAHRGVP